MKVEESQEGSFLDDESDTLHFHKPSNSNVTASGTLEYHRVSSPVGRGSGLSNYSLRAALLASLASILLGYDVGVASGAILFIEEEFSLSNVQKEIFIGSLNFVSFAGALLAGRLSDVVGRRLTVAVSALIFLTGAFMMAFSPSYSILLTGRIVTGIGVGFGFAIAPLYTAELSPSSRRGSLVSLSEVFINVGVLLGYLASFALSPLPIGIGWRWMLGLGAIPALMMGAGVIVMPESPRWLVMQGRMEEASEILRKTSSDDAEADARLMEIMDAAGLDGKGSLVNSGIVEEVDLQERHQETQERSGSGVWKELLFPTPAVRRMLFLCLGVTFFQQATGIDATVYYSPTMFRAAGIRSKPGLLAATVAVGFTKTLFILVATFFLDDFGRRPLLLVSSAGMSVCLFVESIGFWLLSQHAKLPGTSASTAHYENVGLPATLAVLAACSFVAFFSIGMGPICWVLTSEIFPLRLRAQAFGLGTAVNRFTSGTVAMSFLSISDALSPAGAFLLFACMGIVSVIFFYLYVPETKGKSLEEIAKSFDKEEAGAAATVASKLPPYVQAAKDSTHFWQADDDEEPFALGPSSSSGDPKQVHSLISKLKGSAHRGDVAKAWEAEQL